MECPHGGPCRSRFCSTKGACAAAHSKVQLETKLSLISNKSKNCLRWEWKRTILLFRKNWRSPRLREYPCVTLRGSLAQKSCAKSCAEVLRRSLAWKSCVKFARNPCTGTLARALARKPCEARAARIRKFSSMLHNLIVAQGQLVSRLCQQGMFWAKSFTNIAVSKVFNDFSR